MLAHDFAHIQSHHRMEGPRHPGQLRRQLRGARVLQAERRVRWCPCGMLGPNDGPLMMVPCIFGNVTMLTCFNGQVCLAHQGPLRNAQGPQPPGEPHATDRHGKGLQQIAFLGRASIYQSINVTLIPPLGSFGASHSMHSASMSVYGCVPLCIPFPELPTFQSISYHSTEVQFLSPPAVPVQPRGVRPQAVLKEG